MKYSLDLTKSEKTIEDVFGAHIVEGAKYDLECGFDIPFTNVPDDIELPEALVPYSKLGTFTSTGRTFCHFYLKDYIFDGVYGIWNALMWNRNFKKGFSSDKLACIDGIICPDYSNYYDMPRIMQIWNVYRSRAVGYYFNSHGIPAIPNVRWTDVDSYKYAFAGLESGSVVAVGTVGCLRSNNDRKFFTAGLHELINRIRPKTIILYGSLNDEIKGILDTYHQAYLFFPSEISLIHGGRC